MPTVTLTPFRGSNFYMGFSEQSDPNTPVAPSIFPRCKNGTKVEITLNTEEVEEMDGSRRTTLLIKNGQMVKIKYTGSLRPNERGYFEKWGHGVSSDTYTGPTVSTTLAGATLANATSVTVHSNTGLTGSGTIPLVLEPGTATEEIPVFAIPATGGSDPFTLTVDSSYNGGHLKYAHASSGVVKSKASHVLTDQNEGNYFTVEAGYGILYSAGGTAIRIRACKVDKFTSTLEHGKIIIDEIEMVGIVSTVQGSAATVTLEQHAPFLFTQGAYTADGSSTGQALRKLILERTNNLDSDTQGEGLNPTCINFAKLDVKLKYSLILTAFSKIYNTFYGSPTGTTDSQQVGYGSFNALLTQPDTLNTLQYNILTVGYTNSPWPDPQEDGKHWDIDYEGTSVVVPPSGSGPNNAYKLQTTLTNTQFSSY
jgi:hypothetical protein